MSVIDVSFVYSVFDEVAQTTNWKMMCPWGKIAELPETDLAKYNLKVLLRERGAVDRRVVLDNLFDCKGHYCHALGYLRPSLSGDNSLLLKGILMETVDVYKAHMRNMLKPVFASSR